MLIHLKNETETLALGAQLATACTAPCILFLYGELGAGKTTLARGFLQGLGYQDAIKSPTYTLVEPYTINQQLVFHFDLYRIKNPHELEFIGIDDYFTQQAIFIIEWPERSAGILPTPDLTCYIEHQTEGRELQLQAKSARGEEILAKVRNVY